MPVARYRHEPAEPRLQVPAKGEHNDLINSDRKAAAPAADKTASNR